MDRVNSGELNSTEEVFLAPGEDNRCPKLCSPKGFGVHILCEILKSCQVLGRTRQQAASLSLSG